MEKDAYTGFKFGFEKGAALRQKLKIKLSSNVVV